jgi:hypothetical protein
MVIPDKISRANSSAQFAEWQANLFGFALSNGALEMADCVPIS